MRFIERGDEDYPEVLAGRINSPPGLFTKGRLPAKPGVAVVGTRRCTSYGSRLATDYGRAVAKAGWPLISGLARGIDAAAHRGTVAEGGPGVAVLGSGLDVVYPRENLPLARRLLEGGGAVISEYPPGAAPLAWRFPPRNRIIAGLARAVVVVEAAVKGGALITARLALDQGISVFAVPGDVDRPSSEGCNLLIRDGAHPVLGPDDLIEELQLILGPARRHSETQAEDPLVRRLIELGSCTVEDLAGALDVATGSVLARIGALEACGAVTFDGSVVRANGH